MTPVMMNLLTTVDDEATDNTDDVDDITVTTDDDNTVDAVARPAVTDIYW